MTADEQARKIAAGLSEAQRRVMVGATKYPKWSTQLVLERLGLVAMVQGILEITPLGRAVRKVLQDA